MDCARDPDRGSDIQQRSGYFLLCNGHDRSELRMGYLRRVLAHCHPILSQGFTGAAPFSDRLPTAAILAIMKGERPPQPTHPKFTPELQTLMQRCWYQDPHLRPEASEVFEILHGS